MTDLKIERLRSQGNPNDVLQRDATSDDGGKWTDPKSIFAAGQVKVTFGNTDDHVTITIPDGQVTTGSAIQLSVGVTTDRDSDELELDPVVVMPGKIVGASSFDAVVVPANATSKPLGTYLVHYQRM